MARMHVTAKTTRIKTRLSLFSLRSPRGIPFLGVLLFDKIKGNEADEILEDIFKRIRSTFENAQRSK